ncbi:MAG: hypothetical protein OXF45_00240, partial [Candidatus Dadabacteria bacterium]|nr:hypothetical protein [Candidatus Dadabacteria bacterium]
MRKVFSVLAVMASLIIGGWAQEAGAQATRTFTVSHTFTNEQKGPGNLANVADGASGKDAVIDFEITGDLSGLVITDVDLQLDLRHAEIGDLAAHIAHPDGTTQVELFNRLRRDGNSNDGSCSPNTDVLNVTFDDGGQALSCTTSSISTGRRRPTSQALSGFNGKALNDGADRTWQLIVRDIVVDGNGGDLQSTALTIVAEESGILISLTSDDSDNIINEGESVTFTVTLSEAASGSDVNVPITITPSSATIAHTTSGLNGGNLIIRDGSAIGTFTVTAAEDNVGRPNGAITVALGTAPTDHINSNSANSVTFTVIDDDYIRISLTSGDSDDTITEGESVTFTVTLSEAASGSDVNVPITITPSSATIAHTTSGLNGGNLIIRDGSAIGTFSVMATEDTMNELDGTLTVTLGTAPGGYANHHSADSVTITVYDNDGPPVMTIKGFARNESPYVTVVEGEDVVIVLELDKPAPAGTTTSIRAALRVGNSHGLTTSTSQGDFDDTAFETEYSVLDLFNQVEWEFAEGTQELTIRIRTVDDSTAREFTENAAYPMFGASNLDVGHPFSGLFTIPIYIIDNDPAPITVFAEPVTTSISEGQPARFKIRSNREAHSTAPALTVNYSVTQTGSFAAGNLPTNQNITIPAQMNETAEISIPTATDCSASSSGSITLTINEPTMGGTAFGYTVPTPAATVQIGEGGGGGPTVDISGGSDITEGTSATFTLALSCAVSGNVTVNVATDEVSGGQFLDPTPGVQPTQITFTSGGVTTRTFDVPTDDDMIDETNGSVSARITAGTGYDIGSDATATVNVADNDVPTITITAHDFVHEGDTILFTVISDIELANNLVVQLRRDEPDSGTTITIGNMSVTTAGEDYTAGDSLPGSITIPAGSAGTSAVYEVDTTNHRGGEGGHGYYIVEVLCPDRKNGDVGEGNCVIRDTANPPTDTTLSYMYQDLMEGDWTANDPSEKWVRINRLAKPEISIAVSNPPGSTVNPGSNARFTVTASSFIPFGGLTVDIDLTESGDVTDTTTVPSLTFDYAGRTAAETAPGSMNFTVDTKAGSMGTLTVAVQSDTSYTVASGAGSAQVTVETTQPLITLCRVADADATACPGSAVSGSVSEGSELFFLVEIT